MDKRLVFFVLMLVLIPITSFAQKRCDYVNDQIESLSTTIDKDMVRAVAWGESEWHQYGKKRGIYRNKNRDGSHDWGLMQINEVHASDGWSLPKIKSDTAYNLRVGVTILESNLRQAKRLRRKYSIPKKYSDMDIALRMYNGWGSGWKYVRYIRRIYRERPWDEFVTKKVESNDSVDSSTP